MDFLLHRVDGVVERNFWAVQAGTELLSDLLLHESSTATLFKQLAAPMRKKDLEIINLCLSSLSLQPMFAAASDRKSQTARRNTRCSFRNRRACESQDEPSSQVEILAACIVRNSDRVLNIVAFQFVSGPIQCLECIDAAPLPLLPNPGCLKPYAARDCGVKDMKGSGHMWGCAIDRSFRGIEMGVLKASQGKVRQGAKVQKKTSFVSKPFGFSTDLTTVNLRLEVGRCVWQKLGN